MMHGMFDGDLGGFDALDAIAGAAQAVLPVGVGTGVTFGVAEAISFLVDNVKVKRFKWAIGLAGGLLVGGLLWKFRSPVDGALVIGSSIATMAVGWGHEMLIKKQLEKAGIAMPAGFGRFEMRPAQPLLDGFGRYVLEEPDPLFAGMDRGETVQFQNVNPGHFG